MKLLLDASTVRIRRALVSGMCTGAIFGWFPITVSEPEWTPAAVPNPGLDPSWITALNLAPLHGLRFGADLTWTYGPWGRIDLPLVIDGWTFALGLAFSILVTSALGALVAWCLATAQHPRWAAYAGIPITGLLVFTPTPALGIAPSVRLTMLLMGVMIVLLTSSVSDRRAWMLSVGCALVAGALLTVKFSEGLSALIVVLLASAFLRVGWTRWLAIPGSCIGGTLFAWLLAGQRLVDLGPWLAGSIELARGYPTAMATQGIGWAGYPTGLYLSYGALVVLALAVAVRWRRILHNRRRELGLLIATVVLAWILLRVGFTQEGGQLTRSYTTLGLMLLILLRPWSLLAQIVVPVLAASISMSTQGSTASGALEPVTRIRWALDGISAALSDTYRGQLLAEARASGMDRYALPEAMQQQVQGRPTHVDSTETTLAWVYGLNWRPLPVFQAYSVWTEGLDDRNASALTSTSGPEFVLREPLRSIHDRQPLWDQPQTQMALLCDYRTVAQEQYWLLLERSSPGCADAEPMYEAEVRAGEVIRLPPTAEDEILLVSIEPRLTWLERVTWLLFKPLEPIWVSAASTRYRLVPGTSQGPMIARLGPLATDWSAQFGGRFDLGSFSLNRDARVSFSKVRVGPP